MLPKATRLLNSRGTDASSVRQVRLFHPRCVAKAGKDSRFSLGKHNILESARSFYEVVRLMGVVGTFPSDLLQSVFRKIGESLVDGGIFVAGLRNECNVSTTIFQRRAGRFHAIRDIADGYVCKETVLNLDLA